MGHEITTDTAQEITANQISKSSEINELGSALASFHSKDIQIARNGYNPMFKSSFPTLSDLILGTKAELSAQGLSILQFPTGDSEITTMLLHKSGQYLSSKASIKDEVRKPLTLAQARGVSITYLCRYMYTAILGTPSIDSDGGYPSLSEEQNRSSKEPPLTNNQLEIIEELGVSKHIPNAIKTQLGRDMPNMNMKEANRWIDTLNKLIKKGESE